MFSHVAVVKAVNRLRHSLLRVEQLNFGVTEVRPNREKKGHPPSQWMTLVLAAFIVCLYLSV